MTLPPEKLGDKGQRFMITYFDRYDNNEKPFGYSTTEVGARRFLESIAIWPVAFGGRIVDRGEKK